MNKTRLQTLVLCASIIGLSTLVLANTPKDAAVATVNGKPISVEYLNRKYQESMRFAQGKPPTKEAVLNDLIKRELGIQEANKLGLQKDPDVQDKINTVLYNALLE